jgi:pantetheine-phosphate adenylyltransferase
MSNTAIYPGTFDPFTNGHMSLVQRGLKLFDNIIIAVGENPAKKYLFDIDERIAQISEAVSGLNNVEVDRFDGLLVDYAREKKVDSVIRGLRAVSDFEYELQLALMNRKLSRNLETVFLMPALRYIFLSSTIVKEAASFGGDISDLVPTNVQRALHEKFGK